MCARHRPGSYSTISCQWREPAAHAGAQTGPRQFVAKPRSLRTKTERTSLAATRAPSALCLRASAPPVNVLYPQACLLICYSPTSYVFACPCDPTSRTTPSECVTVMRQPLPSLLIVSTKKRAQLADPQNPRTFKARPIEHSKPRPRVFSPLKLSTHFPRPHPRTFNAHTLELSTHFPKPSPPKLYLSYPRSIHIHILLAHP